MSLPSVADVRADEERRQSELTQLRAFVAARLRNIGASWDDLYWPTRPNGIEWATKTLDSGD